MNKELINKYKLEFDHWLKNPDGLLFYDEHHNGWHNLHCDYQWNCTIAEIEEFGKYGYVINDEYVELRKALAEGKVIQIYDVIEQHPSDRTFDKFGWRDFKSFTASSSFSKTPDLYRIKPDEPKFKVGDFVRYVHSTPAKALEINNINGNRYYFTNSEMSCVEHELEPWTPVKGEWCWFYDSKSGKFAALAQFKEINNDYFISITDASWKYCEPFLNSLPSYLKDK